jgi:hypothetical protein
MSRTRRVLAMLALSLGLVTATSAAIAAPTSSAVEDQNDRLLRSIQAQVGRTEAEIQRAQAMARTFQAQVGRTEAEIQRAQAMARTFQAAAPVEDQNDRLLRNLQATQTERTQAAVQLARAMERNLAPAPPVGGIAAQPAPRSDPVVPGHDVAVLTTLLVGLIGGLIGGAAAMAGWTAASRRRLHRAASAT